MKNQNFFYNRLKNVQVQIYFWKARVAIALYIQTKWDKNTLGLLIDGLIVGFGLQYLI